MARLPSDRGRIEKLALHGHLAYGPVKAGDRPVMREVCPVIAVYRDDDGAVVGCLRSDGGVGAIGYGRETAHREDVRP